MKSRIHPPQPAPTPPHFSRRFSSTPRGARLARLLAVQYLAGLGWPPSSAAGEAVALVVAELAANAVAHGRVAGRDFRLALALEGPDALRVEVTDPRGERRPRACTPAAVEETGRGLLLVGALAERWGVEPHPPSGKTVWARIAL